MKKNNGFTLMELLVVVVIIGILATFVAPQFFDQPEKARRVAATQQLRAISEALEMYNLDNHTYPTSEQGLSALVEKPVSPPQPKAWKTGGYLKSMPADPWGQPYVYLSPGVHGPFDLISYGADGKKGGDEDNKDIVSWE